MSERYLDISLRVNGEDVRERVEARKTLVDFLRDDLGLTGSHIGCEQGVCGACTVLVDGDVVRGCLVLAVQCDGAEVQTIEGISDSGRIADLQDAFQRRNALQCGFCTPGMLIGAQDLLSRGGSAEPRCDPRAYFRQLLPLHRLSGYRRRHRIRRYSPRLGAGGKGRLTMNEHAKPNFAKPLTLSERADELEEKMMHELGERIATKSVLFGMADGKVEMESGRRSRPPIPINIF